METTQYDLFRGTPPHSRRSETSRDAAEAIAPKTGRLQQVVLQAIRNASYGLTRDEVEQVTGLPHTTASARVRELFLLGLLETRLDATTGKSIRRLTRSGKSAEVCFLAPRSAFN